MMRIATYTLVLTKKFKYYSWTYIDTPFQDDPFQDNPLQVNDADDDLEGEEEVPKELQEETDEQELGNVLIYSITYSY